MADDTSTCSKSQDLALLFCRAKKTLGSKSTRRKTCAKSTAGAGNTSSDSNPLRKNMPRRRHTSGVKKAHTSFFDAIDLSSEEEEEAASRTLPPDVVESADSETQKPNSKTKDQLEVIAETQTELGERLSEHQTDSGINSHEQDETRNDSVSVAYPFLSPTSEFQLFDQSMVRTIRKASTKKQRVQKKSESVNLGAPTVQQTTSAKKPVTPAKSKKTTPSQSQQAAVDYSGDAQILCFPSDQLPRLQLDTIAGTPADMFDSDEHEESSPELYVPGAGKEKKTLGTGRRTGVRSTPQEKPQNSIKTNSSKPSNKVAGTGAKKTKNKLLSAVAFSDSDSDASGPITRHKNKVATTSREPSGTKAKGKKTKPFFAAVQFSDSDSDLCELPCMASTTDAPAEGLLVPNTCKSDVSLRSSFSSTLSESQDVDELCSRMSRILSQKPTKKTKSKGKAPAVTKRTKSRAKFVFAPPPDEQSESLDLSGLHGEQCRVPSPLGGISLIPDSQAGLGDIRVIAETPAPVPAEAQHMEDSPETQTLRLYPELPQTSDDADDEQSTVGPTDSGHTRTLLRPARLYPVLPEEEPPEETAIEREPASVFVPETVQTIADSAESVPTGGKTHGDGNSEAGTCTGTPESEQQDTLMPSGGTETNDFSLHLSVSTSIQSPPRSSVVQSPSSVGFEMKVTASQVCESTCRLVFSPSKLGSPDVCNASLQVSMASSISSCSTKSPGRRSPWSSARKAASIHASLRSPVGPSPGSMSVHMSVGSKTPDFSRKAFATSPPATSPEMCNISLQVSVPGDSSPDASLLSVASSPGQCDQSAQISMSSPSEESSNQDNYHLSDDSTVERARAVLLNDTDVGNSYVCRAAQENSNDALNNSGICYQKQGASYSPRMSLFPPKPGRRSITFRNTEECIEYAAENRGTDQKLRAWRRDSAISVTDMSFRTARPSPSSDASDSESSFSSSGSSQNAAFRTCQEWDFDPADLEDDASPGQAEAKKKRKNRLSLKGRKTLRLGTTCQEEEEEEDGCLPDLGSPGNRAPEAQACIEISDSEEDEQLENFFQKIKTPATNRRCNEDRDPRPSLQEFIVSDSDCSEEEEEEDGMFYPTTFATPMPRAEDKENSCNGAVVDCSSSDEDFTRPAPFRTPRNPIAKPRSWTTKPGGRPPKRAADHASVVDTWATPQRQPLQSLGQRGNATPLRYGFLKSLSPAIPDDKRDPDATRYVKNFKKNKEELCAHLFKLYNRTVFDNQLPADLKLQWNPRLAKTAGYCTYKKFPRTGSRLATIDLSNKVCDSPERVRDTLIHEMCHAAVWLIHCVNGGHGPQWKFWAQKATKVHCELPVISRCHAYTINYKYQYRCTSCGYEIGRHSKSLDTERKVCGYCRSPFQLTVNTPRGPVAAKARGAKTPNRFALFVKENYGSVKSRGGLSHKDVMNALSKDFAAMNKI